ncbi:hypothetical protein [Pontimicrobium sp. SW4]|uniref:Uncharacterized protein n=1 Tax=Pontimicrobium sp. SW4 TaxID=3153519 RepID=A0AAU7BWY4_9FLAO
MLNIIIAAVVVIALTIGIVWVIDKYVPKKAKPFIMIVLWVLIGYLGYSTFMSVYGEIKFNKLKDKRYAQVIESLIDIRDAELAHRTVTGKFEGDFDNLIKFIDTAQFTITQRRDSSVIDEEQTRRFQVDTYKDIVIVDTLGYVSVKDSLFGADPRYKTMMNIPSAEPGAKFELKAGFLEQNGMKIPVFEAKAMKSIILFDQDKNLIAKENQVISVDGVNGDAIKVGSMEEVNTTGNWPKNFSNEQ